VRRDDRRGGLQRAVRPSPDHCGRGHRRRDRATQPCLAVPFARMSDQCEPAELSAAKERAWRQAAEIDAADCSGDLDEAGWHAAWLALIEPANLAGGNPRAESGHSGDAARWELARRLLVDAIQF